MLFINFDSILSLFAMGRCLILQIFSLALEHKLIEHFQENRKPVAVEHEHATQQITEEVANKDTHVCRKAHVQGLQDHVW